MKSLVIILAFLSFNSSEIFAGTPVEFQMLSTADETVGITNILESEWQSKFRDASNFSRTAPEKFYWLKIDFKGHDLSGAEKWTLSVGFFDEIILYFKDKDAFGSRISGGLIPDTDTSPEITEAVCFFTHELIQGRYLYVRIKHVRDILPFQANTVVFNNASASDSSSYTIDEFSLAIPVFLFIGGITVMMLYALGVFFVYRDKAFLYYSFYLLALLLYLGRRTISLDYFSHFPQTNYIFNEVIQVIVNITYLSFILNFVNAKKNYPLLHKASHYVFYFLWFVIIVELTLLTTNIFSPIQFYFINFERYFMSFFAALGIFYILFRLKDTSSLFIIIGSFFFIGGALCALFLLDVRWMMGGAILEIFTFALGLGYRFQKIQKEKQRMEREIDQVRLTALKAQMNPHFIFNSLNSIRSYIIVNETKKASDYLTKFSKLIRLILQYASSDYITLKEEISALELYVSLEQMRFREYFGFTISIDPDLDLEKVQIPPLIFQPYIENAIWHGLTPKIGKKAISLVIEKRDQEINCIIRDNGIGRTQAKKIGTNGTGKKSMALDLTRDRLNLISTGSTQSNVKIIDLITDGRPSGTEVKLTLPLIVTAA